PSACARNPATTVSPTRRSSDLQTPGPIQDAIKKLQADDQIFSYGISDHPVKGLDVAKPNGKVVLVSPKELAKNLPQPFKAEPTGDRKRTRLNSSHQIISYAALS